MVSVVRTVAAPYYTVLFSLVSLFLTLRCDIPVVLAKSHN